MFILCSVISNVMVCLLRHHCNLRHRYSQRVLFRENNIPTSVFPNRNRKLRPASYTLRVIYQLGRPIHLRSGNVTNCFKYDTKIYTFGIVRGNFVFEFVNHKRRNLQCNICNVCFAFTFEFNLFKIRSDNYKFKFLQFNVFTDFLQTGIVTPFISGFIRIFLVKPFLQSCYFSQKYLQTIVQVWHQHIRTVSVRLSTRKINSVV